MTVRYSRRASAEQLQRFEEEFKRSLMQFYGNALLEYDNQDIRVLPVANAQDAQRSTVNMEIRDARGTVYPLSYTMVRLDEQWKLRNMVINGINVGKLFRDQFAQSMQSNRNDLDKTIAGWAELVARSRQGEQAAAQ
jgi:phospholipid transport system substrate-binding protein